MTKHKINGIECRFAPRDSVVMKFIGRFIGDNFWVTIGDTIYYPATIKDPTYPQYRVVREHEAMHVAQFKKYGVLLMALMYIAFPLPILFSGRWFIERNPYLHDIKSGAVTINEAVSMLARFYLYPWPKTLMRRWFERQV